MKAVTSVFAAAVLCLAACDGGSPEDGRRQAAMSQPAADDALDAHPRGQVANPFGNDAAPPSPDAPGDPSAASGGAGAGAATTRSTAPTTYPVDTAALTPAAPAGSCSDGKRYCRDMSDCADARFHLEQCGLNRLDGDGDGVPCESICR